MNIWIDLANSPHVLFFAPIIRELENRGHRLFVTHRDFAQTRQLCKIFKLNSTEIGIHGGQGVFHKIKNIVGRSIQLKNFAINKKIELAISHNSYAHCLAAKIMGIKYLTMMDYEYQPANHINFRLADEIMVPFTFNIQDVLKYGAKNGRLIRYPGFKEEIYLKQFKRDINFWLDEFPELDSKKIMCAVRPPATMAAYHNFKNPIFKELIAYLLSHKNVQVVFFTRTENQRLEYSQLFKDLFIANKSVNGAQLIANSDLVISAGGTMNREAAILGIPAYTIFAGKFGSVDNYLLRNGRITMIQKKDDFQRICLKKNISKAPVINEKVFNFVIDRIINTSLS